MTQGSAPNQATPVRTADCTAEQTVPAYDCIECGAQLLHRDLAQIGRLAAATGGTGCGGCDAHQRRWQPPSQLTRRRYSGSGNRNDSNDRVWQWPELTGSPGSEPAGRRRSAVGKLQLGEDMAQSDRPRVEQLLEHIAAGDGWDGSPAGRELLRVHAPAIAKSVAARWVRTAGSDLADELLTPIWEAWTSLIASGRIENAAAVARKAALRSAALAAAQVQTGVGSDRSRDLVARVRDRQLLGRAELPIAMPAEESNSAGLEALEPWVQILGAMLARAGWSWPRPALTCLSDVLATVPSTGRRRRSPMAQHATGVPAETWGALELLVFGGGPGSLSYRRASGAKVIWSLYGGEGLRADPEIQRVVAAAVSGRATRSGRRAWLNGTA